MTASVKGLPARMKAAEVAAHLGISVDTVYELNKSGKLPAVPHGNRSWRWKAETVLAFDSGASSPPSDLTALIDARVAEHFERFAAQLRGAA